MISIFALVCTILIPQSFAENFWRTPFFKWDKSPTMCAFEPSDSMFSNLGTKMLTETENAVVDWQLKLNGENSGNNPWHMNLIKIPYAKISSYNTTNCDITVNFKPQPDVIDPSSYETGITRFENFPKVSVTIYYLGADLNINEYGGGSFVYNTYLATDPQIQSTVRHEIGHALGLAHYVVGDDELNRIYRGLEDSPSIMVENGLVGSGVTHYDITLLDIAEVKSIYGSNGFPVPQKQIPQNSSPSNIQTPKLITPINSSTPTPSPIITKPVPSKIPSWVKKNANWWSKETITDDEFVSGMQYLIQQGILKVQNVPVSNSGTTMPGWVRGNAGLWADGSISDYEFLRGIQYLISMGLIKV